MVRNLVLGVGALVLAAALIITCGAVVLRLSGTYEVMHEAPLGLRGEAVKRALAEGRDLEHMLRPATEWLEFAVYPARWRQLASLSGCSSRAARGPRSPSRWRRSSSRSWRDDPGQYGHHR